jgi:uncharacterized protein YecE (DUF72 family)
LGARELSGEVRIGCSGWSYKDWRGVVYPAGAPARTWFAHYAELFDTVEINNTFYRLPDASTVEAWATQAPPGFLYASKVGRFGSHRKKLRDPGPWLERHLERIERLGVHGGPNLLQLPPRWGRDPERLDAFLAVAPRRIRWAVELRDPSWLHEEVYEVLERHGAALCIHDLLPDHPWRLTADWTYLRFHGPHALREPYHGAYGPKRLGPVATVIRGWVAEGTDVYAYFNNDWHGNAVRDATWLRDEVAQEISRIEV